MKTQHTPGPWSVVHLGTREERNVFFHTFNVITPNTVEHNNEIGEANARLIAAAPESTQTLFKTYVQLLKDLPFDLRASIRWQYLLSSMRSDLANAYGIDPQELEAIAAGTIIKY